MFRTAWPFAIGSQMTRLMQIIILMYNKKSRVVPRFHLICLLVLFAFVTDSPDNLHGDSVTASQYLMLLYILNTCQCAVGATDAV